MNSLTIIGNVCHTPEMRSTQSGKTVCSFDVAVNSKRRDGATTYFRVSAWEALAGVCQQYLTTGKKVCVVGEVSARAYESRDGQPRASLEVTAREVEFLSPKAESQPPAEPVPPVADIDSADALERALAAYGKDATATGAELPAGFTDITDSDLPF